MPTEKTAKPKKMQTDFGGGGGIRKPQPWIPDQRDGFISWIQPEFAAANWIIDALCHHLRFIGEPGEYDLVIGWIHQRRVSWNPVLQRQQLFPVTEIMHSLQQVEWMRQKRVVDQFRVRGNEFGGPVVLNFGSRQVQRDEATGETHGLDCRNLAGNAFVVRKSNDQGLSLDVPNAIGAPLNTQNDGSLKTSGNPCGANNPYTKTQLKDVKNEEISNSDDSCDSLVAKNDLDIQNQKEEDSLAVSPTTFNVVETNNGNTVNVAEGLSIHEELPNQAETLKLVTPGDVLNGKGYEDLQLIRSDQLRIKWSHDEDLHLINVWLNTDKVITSNIKPKPYWNRISDHYWNGKLDMWVGRGPRQCKSRWSKINVAVIKFASCYEEASKQKTSENSEDDVIRYACKLYHNDIKMDFKLEYAWRALRYEPKYRDAHLNVTAKTTEDSGGGTKRKRFNEPEECSLSSSSTPPLSVRKKGEKVEREDSDEVEAGLQCGTTREGELKTEDAREERKMEMQREYLLAKKYELLSNLVAQSGVLTAGEVMFKKKLVEDLLKQ